MRCAGVWRSMEGGYEHHYRSAAVTAPPASARSHLLVASGTGWWLVALLVILLIFLIAYWWRRNIVRRAALRELRQLQRGVRDPQQRLSSLALLLRRYAIASHPIRVWRVWQGKRGLSFLITMGVVESSSVVPDAASLMLLLKVTAISMTRGCKPLSPVGSVKTRWPDDPLCLALDLPADTTALAGAPLDADSNTYQRWRTLCPLCSGVGGGG